jgi:hypothetical protein
MAAFGLLSNHLAGFSDEELKVAAWTNATPYGAGDVMRIDCDGRYVSWSDYGKLSTYGWQIDHIAPKALGGLDVPSNVRARHHLGNARAGGLLGNALANVRR